VCLEGVMNEWSGSGALVLFLRLRILFDICRRALGLVEGGGHQACFDKSWYVVPGDECLHLLLYVRYQERSLSIATEEMNAQCQKRLNPQYM